MRATGPSGRWLACLVPCVLLAAVLVGCSSDKEGQQADSKRAATTASTDGKLPVADVPDGYRRVAVSAEGFALAVPSAWKDIPLTAEELKPFIDANPEITSLVGDDPAAFLERTKFFAYDAEGSGTNVNVVKSPSPGTSVEELADGLEEILVSQLNAGDVKVGVAEAPAGKVARVSYVLPFNLPDGGSADVTQVQYHFLSGDVDYVLTFTLFGDFVGKDLPAQVAGSFRLT